MAKLNRLPKIVAFSWIFLWMLHFVHRSDGKISESLPLFRNIRRIDVKLDRVDNSSSLTSSTTTVSPVATQVTAANLTVLNSSDFLWNQIFESKPAPWKGFVVPTWINNNTNSSYLFYQKPKISTTAATTTIATRIHYPKIFVAVAATESPSPTPIKNEKIQSHPYFNDGSTTSRFEYSKPHVYVHPESGKESSVQQKFSPYHGRVSGMAMGKSYNGNNGPMMNSGGYGSIGNSGSGGGSRAPYGNMMSGGSNVGAGGSYGSMMHGTGGYDGSYSHNYGSMYGSGAGMMGHGGYGGMMAGYSAPKDDLGFKGFFNKLLALLPVGLLLAVALPSLVVIPNRRSLSEQASVDHKLTESYPILDMINFYGIKSLQDENCFRHVICKTVRMGSEEGGNVFQQQLWTVANWMDEKLAQNLGIKDMWSRILKDQCSVYICQKKSIQNASNSDV